MIGQTAMDSLDTMAFVHSSFLVILCATSCAVAVSGKTNSIRDAFSQDSNLLSCPEDWDLFEEEKTCLSRPIQSEVSTRDSAQTICHLQGGYLATATNPQMEFLSRNYAVNPFKNRTDVKFWMSYIMIHSVHNSSGWNVVQEKSDQRQPDHLPGLFPTSVPKNLSDKAVVCLQLHFHYNSRNQLGPLEWITADCNQRVPFMCQKPASGRCIDRSGNVVAEGEQFSPLSHDDACIRCHCFQGTASVCSSARCGNPVCSVYRPDENECCKYTCVDSNGNLYVPDDHGDTVPPVYLGDSMRWVLTMVTSFLLLGMMLFMVYRMRQKRLAYLRYRVRQLQELQMDFEPGSGPPVPSVDDLDGSFFREPPPPYSFFKDDPVHMDSPPPYPHNCANPSRRLMLDRSCRRSDEVSLLRHSATSSLPGSPASDQASAPVFITPPESPNSSSHQQGSAVAAHPSTETLFIMPVEPPTSNSQTPANTSVSSFLSDPMTSPGRNTAV